MQMNALTLEDWSMNKLMFLFEWMCTLHILSCLESSLKTLDKLPTFRSSCRWTWFDPLSQIHSFYTNVFIPSSLTHPPPYPSLTPFDPFLHPLLLFSQLHPICNKSWTWLNDFLSPSFSPPSIPSVVLLSILFSPSFRINMMHLEMRGQE